ncbi:MAG TPA: AsmA family protein [Candidatus Acidoferrum sp.]|nr:AsmA family protein [Candidatus Acidoferrum sp.]
MALVLAVFALQLGVNLVLRTHRVHDAMIARLQRTFGRPVEVRSFSASLLPLPSLDADGITVGEDSAFGNEYFLRADRLSARLRLFGLLTGRFEFGTLSLDRPSLILVKNADGRWNLERWLPPSFPPDGSSPGKPRAANSPDAAANRLAKIEVSEGRVNFKLGDDKKPFAFTSVNGSVEQTALGRWQINLEAQPWRSGAQLQTTGTIQVRGEVAGTSVRLRPARLQIRWTQASLADIVRLARGQDDGVRGLFDLDAMAESGTTENPSPARPGEWNFSLHARASEIHRWDLTQRADNPKLELQAKGRWFPADGSINLDEMNFAFPKSNLRGTASFTTVPQTNFAVHVDSAGIQASDLLAWYRAFTPGVSEGVSLNQYFTGAATLRGWPIRLEAAAFSSHGGNISFASGDAAAIHAGPVRGGMEKNSFVIEPVALTWLESAAEKGSAPEKSNSPKGKSPAAAASPALATLSVGLRYDFDSSEGGVSIVGKAEKTDDVLKAAAAFGRQVNRGWEWTGQTSAALERNWGNPATSGWNGQMEFTKGELQIAGLNQPVKLKSATLRWRKSAKTVALESVEAFGGAWDGEIAESLPSESASDAGSRWRFQLHADALSAADMDRWMGPRARPNWLQRLLPAMLGGSKGQTVDAGDLLRRIDAEGDVSVDEFSLEKLKLKQVRAHASLRGLRLHLEKCEAQWAGGTLEGSVAAEFDAKPVYELKLRANGVALAQVPLAGKIADRFAGALDGTMDLRTEGVGREALLDKLMGEGRIQLKKIEFRGWDVPASFASGALHAGASRWIDGEGMFHVSGRSVEVNNLRLRAPQGEVSLKGSVSFGRDADLTMESPAPAKSKTPRPDRIMQISGPLEGPKVAIQTVAPQQPGD